MSAEFEYSLVPLQCGEALSQINPQILGECGGLLTVWKFVFSLDYWHDLCFLCSQY